MQVRLQPHHPAGLVRLKPHLQTHRFAHRAQGLGLDAAVVVVPQDLADNLRKLVYVGTTSGKRAARLCRP